jgi:predicted tellurium resistance membrane protein TerC
MQQENNTLQKLPMSINRQAIIDAFIERQRDNFNELIHNLTIYYNNIRLHFSNLSEKSNQRYLFLSILLSFIFLIIITLIIFEYRRLLKYIQKFFRFIYSYTQLLLIRIRNKFLQKTTPSLLNLLLNSKSHIQEKFSKEFLRSLNQELVKRKVKKKK